KLLIDELDLPRSSDFLPSLDYDSFLFEEFFEVDALPSTNNKDKVFYLSILIHENLSEVTIRISADKNVKKIAISHASLILKDFDPPLYELPFQKEVPRSNSISNERSSFLGGNVIRASSSANSSSKWSIKEEEEVVLPLNGLITFGEGKSE
nr:hypothetical protein [Tanacetum cinerariifolium]